MAIALDNLRVGRCYSFKNYGENRRLKVLARISREDFEVLDLDTTEKYTLEELLRYGKGKDYALFELDEHDA
ncbi:MAG: hypothetical protein ACXIT9_11585 [Nitritalea sp.]